MSKLFFIIGLRRSGTSILRELLLKHSQIKDIEFEPHPLWNAVDLNHFTRFKDLPYVRSTIEKFRKQGEGDKWYGAKFALNPGVKAMEWVWLDKTFPEAKFIFIYRNLKDTFKSYYKQDKDAVRGYVPEEIYHPFANLIHKTFIDRFSPFDNREQPILYESLIKNPDEELKKIWWLLGISPMTGFNKYMRKPENWGQK